jgi:dUTP pyrophosphatase
MISFLNPLIKVKYFSDKIRRLAPATDGSSGYDLQVNTEDEHTLYPGETLHFGTGLAIHISDKNYAAIILPRSGRGSKGLVIANLVGLIDSDYQGEIGITLWNRSTSATLTIKPFERVAQLLLIPVIRPIWEEVTEFSKSTARGSNGFGSTGQ